MVFKYLMEQTSQLSERVDTRATRWKKERALIRGQCMLENVPKSHCEARALWILTANLHSLMGMSIFVGACMGRGTREEGSNVRIAWAARLISSIWVLIHCWRTHARTTQSARIVADNVISNVGWTTSSVLFYLSLYVKNDNTVIEMMRLWHQLVPFNMRSSFACNCIASIGKSRRFEF